MAIPYRRALTEHMPHVLPRDGISDLEAGVLDGAGHPVVRARASEGEKVAAGFENAVRLSCPQLVPRLHLAGIGRREPGSGVVALAYLEALGRSSAIDRPSAVVAAGVGLLVQHSTGPSAGR